MHTKIEPSMYMYYCLKRFYHYKSKAGKQSTILRSNNNTCTCNIKMHFVHLHTTRMLHTHF